MENETKTPKKILAQMQLARLGKIAFVWQFIAVAVMLVSVITFLAAAMYYLVLIVIILGSAFLILLSSDFQNWLNAGDGIMQFSVSLANWWKYAAPVALALSVLSIVCLCADRHRKHLARIILSALVALFAVIYYIVKLIYTGV